MEPGAPLEQAGPVAPLPWRVLGAWANLRGSMRAELDRAPGEGRLLFYLMLSQIIWLSGKLMALQFGPLAATLTADDMAREASGHVASVFFLVLLMYGFAALGHGVAKALAGAGSWRESRAAMFWAALVAAPAMLAVQLITVIAVAAPEEVGWMSGVLSQPILGIVAAFCFAEAHRFRSWWRGLAVILVMATLVLAFGAAIGLVMRL